MKKFCFVFLFGITTLFSFGQTTDSNVSNQEKLKKYEGTYQLEVINTREKPLIPANLDEIIEKNRDKNKTVFVSLGTHVRLKILPEAEIKKNRFKKIETVKYIIE